MKYPFYYLLNLSNYFVLLMQFVFNKYFFFTYGSAYSK